MYLYVHVFIHILHIREIKISDKNGYYLDLKFLKIKILNSICMTQHLYVVIIILRSRNNEFTVAIVSP